MKSAGLTTLLNAALMVCLLACMVLSFQYVMLARESRRLNADLALINQRRALMNSMVTDCVEYSKKNPAILPILETIGVKPAKPAAK